MAFKKDEPQQNDNWKNDAFLNLYVPTNGGKRRKVGSIGLKLSKPFEADLIEKLKSDPEAVKRLLAACELEFNLAEPETDDGKAAF